MLLKLLNQNAPTTPLVVNILNYKNIPFVNKQNSHQLSLCGPKKPALQDQKLLVCGTTECIEYLDERHPSPQLITGEPNQRAIVRMMSYSLIDLALAPEKENEFNKLMDEFYEEYKTHEYLIGNTFSLLDLAVLTFAPKLAQKWTQQINRLNSHAQRYNSLNNSNRYIPHSYA